MNLATILTEDKAYRYIILTTLFVVFFGTTLMAQSSCFKRILTENHMKIDFNTDQIDSICNGQILWSKKHGYFGYEIHNNLYDSQGRIIRKIMMNYLRVELAIRPPEDFPQYKAFHTDNHTLTRIDTLIFNYKKENLTVKPNFINTEIETIVFDLLANRMYPMEVSRVDFHYEYIEDKLIIKMEEFDLAGQSKVESILNDTFGNSSQSALQKRVENLRRENTYIVGLISDNILDVKSEKIPEKPSLHSGIGDWTKAINCKVYLDSMNRVKKIDEYWRGKTIFEYHESRLFKQTVFRFDKIYQEKIVK